MYCFNFYPARKGVIQYSLTEIYSWQELSKMLYLIEKNPSEDQWFKVIMSIINILIFGLGKVEVINNDL